MNSKKIALVTGASRGIGKAIAFALAKAGNIVYGTATTQLGADSISKNFNDENLTGMGLVLDVTSSDSIASLFNFMKERGETPQILVNNAAVTRDNLLLRMKDDEWNSVIDTNLNAIYRLSKTCLRDMLKAHWGRIINIGSVVGNTGNPGQVNYTAAKAGLIGFTKSLAQEVGSRNITVNVVSPGFVETDMTSSLTSDQLNLLMQRIPLQRTGKPEDIAAAVVFLASESASYITGQTLHVNGGMFMD